ncbi:hypothetical protein N801_04160 [Knoellia aerolata DSM 18566]|uniref:Uncharacterized protein n=1 Tax=Knoellia aerolata DSM 18566 TaxID=1385519 RepID=A0A0A0JYS6_9MICO|nr:hypothetical protein N801_04160 [Knoellia aerolata DSM 18566]
MLVGLVGLGLAVLYAVKSADTSPVEPGSAEIRTGAAGESHGQAHRDAVAAAPMLEVEPDDSKAGTPAATPAPVLAVPAATTTGPVEVPTGFPKSPAGAIGQLAAIETTVLQGMSIPHANDVYEQWALPGGVGAADWPLIKNVQAFLASAQQGQTKDPFITVSAHPTAAQVKGIDGSDWVLACVLLDMRAVITTEARVAYGYCERMQWVGDDQSGRWMIAPGELPATAPSTWPDTDLAVKAGWRTWVDAEDSGVN